MAAEWASARISDIAEVTDYVANGSFESLRNNVTYRSEPDYAVLVRLVDHNAGWTGDFVYVDRRSYDFLRKSVLFPGDVVIANVGANAGTVFRVPDLGLPMTLGPNAVLCRPRDEGTLRRDFLYYYLVSKTGQESIRSILSGSAQPKFNKTDLRRLSMPVPPLREQRDIAHILGTLDHKIELNRRMSETLESFARLLFASWFVDFGPVRAKREGREAGLPSEIATLFPDQFKETDLGEVPAGWGLGVFADVVEVLRDQENPLDSPDHVFAHFSIPAFDDGRTPKREYGRAIKSLKFRVPAGVVLLSKLNPEIDRVWMVDVLSDERSVCSTEFLVLRGRTPFTRAYIYCLARSPLFRQQLAGLVTGTSKSHQRAQAESVLNLGVVVPPPRVVEVFDRLVEASFTRVLTCRRETMTLTALRDLLVPKLISGEVRIKDPTKVVVEAR